MTNEADTCRRYVVPKLAAAGWDDDPHAIVEQYAFTDGRIMVSGKSVYRRPGKLFFTIYDYTGSVTRKFADPRFDGVPDVYTQEEIDEYGRTINTTYTVGAEDSASQPDDAAVGESPYPPYTPDPAGGQTDGPPRKFYYDGGRVEIVAQLVFELDADFHQINHWRT